MKMMTKGLAGRWHVHGCADCGARYVDACVTPGTNVLCDTCRLGFARPYDRGQWDPRPCCANARLVNYGETLLALRHAGDSRWFRCDECARTFTVHPKDQQTTTCERCTRTVPHTHRTRRDL